MTTFKVTQGDIGDYDEFDLGGIANWGDATGVEGLVWREYDNTIAHVLTGSWVDQASGRCRIDYSPWLESLAFPTEWQFKIQVHFTSGDKLSFPEDYAHIIEVQPVGAP